MHPTDASEMGLPNRKYEDLKRYVLVVNCLTVGKIELDQVWAGMANVVISKQRSLRGFVDWREGLASLWSFTVEEHQARRMSICGS